MGDEETFEKVGAGAALVKPLSAGDIKVGKFCMVKGNPCKILDVSHCKTGKHGSARAIYVGEDIFDGKKYHDDNPVGAACEEPIVTRTEYQLVDINYEDVNENGAICSLLTAEGGNIDDLRIPDKDPEYKGLRDAFAAGGDKDIFVTVLEAVAKRKVLSQYLTK